MATQSTFTIEEAEKRYQSLPFDIQEIIYKPEMFSAAQLVGQTNRLPEDSISILAAETTFVMLGFTDLKDFPTILAERLRVELRIAQKIAAEIDIKLFTPVKNSIIKMNALNPPAESENEEGASAPNAPVTLETSHIRNVLSRLPLQ